MEKDHRWWFNLWVWAVSTVPSCSAKPCTHDGCRPPCLLSHKCRWSISWIKDYLRIPQCTKLPWLKHSSTTQIKAVLLCYSTSNLVPLKRNQGNLDVSGATVIPVSLPFSFSLEPRFPFSLDFKMIINKKALSNNQQLSLTCNNIKNHWLQPGFFDPCSLHSCFGVTRSGSSPPRIWQRSSRLLHRLNNAWWMWGHIAIPLPPA